MNGDDGAGCGARAPGDIADPPHRAGNLFPDDVAQRFEFYSYRNAATILAHSYPEHFDALIASLRGFSFTKDMIRRPGGSKGPIATLFEESFSEEWREVRISADLLVRLHPAKGGSEAVIAEYRRSGYFDGHRIDLLNGKVALDIEWNSKDQTYDRDLYAFGAFYEAGAIDVGIIFTRGVAMNNAFFQSLGPILNKDGTEGSTMTAAKFGASTTGMGKLLYRLEAGRNGGCPVLAIGITPACVSDWTPPDA